MQKRIAAIHDISCFGRCSLTVALPILSASGIETSVIPTAVLSTHTGGFTGFTFKDLSDDILPIAEHWKTLGLNFDALYTGYLGSFRQLDIISKLFDMLADEKTLIYVDPVMADEGKLYTAFSPDFPRGMAKLCKKAHVIVPNITEALFMLGEEYMEGPYEEEYIVSLLKKLSRLGAEKIVLTGVYFDDYKLGAATYDSSTDTITFALNKKLPGFYHGTGDVFGSALLGALLNNRNLNESAEIAVDFTLKSLERSRKAVTDNRFGVNFEQGLGDYAKLFTADMS